MITKPDFILLEILRDTPAKCKCGRNLIRFSAKLENSKTGELFTLGSECFKKFTGKTFSEIASDNRHYNEQLLNNEKEENLRSFHAANIKKFIEANREIIEWIENRKAQEDKIFDLAVVEFKSFPEKYRFNFPKYRGEIWESFLLQIEKNGSLSEKQITFILEDKSRNREIKYTLKEKITVDGTINKISVRFGFSGGHEFTAKMRLENNVDVFFPLNDNLRIALGLDFFIVKDRIGNPIAVEKISGNLIIKIIGTIAWIDPAGGKIKLIRCKKVF